MNEINLKYNTMPQQVQINKNKIEQLENIIMQPYNTNEVLTEQTTTIDISLTSIPQEQPQNILLIDKNGLLFKVAGYSTIENTTTVHIIFWCNLKGVQGERGEVGPQGPSGLTVASDIENLLEIGTGLVGDITEGGDKYELHVDETVIATKEEVEQIEEELNPINSKLARALLTPMTAPLSDILVGVDKANGQQNIAIGDGLSLSNGILSVTGGSGIDKKYMHNIVIEDNNKHFGLSVDVLTNSPTPFTYATLLTYLKNNSYLKSSNPLPCSGVKRGVGTDSFSVGYALSVDSATSSSMNLHCLTTTIKVTADFTAQKITPSFTWGSGTTTINYSSTNTKVYDKVYEL